jgi:arylsulfatase A-like enzyme
MAVIAAALALLATGVALAARPGAEADAATKPNIVLMLSDDQTLESLSKMPFTSTMRAVKFTNAFVNTPQCCPSRSTILTGQYS